MKHTTAGKQHRANIQALANIETVETVAEFILGAPKSLQMVIADIKLKDAYSLEGKL